MREDDAEALRLVDAALFESPASFFCVVEDGKLLFCTFPDVGWRLRTSGGEIGVLIRGPAAVVETVCPTKDADLLTEDLPLLGLLIAPDEGLEDCLSAWLSTACVSISCMTPSPSA